MTDEQLIEELERSHKFRTYGGQGYTLHGEAAKRLRERYKFRSECGCSASGYAHSAAAMTLATSALIAVTTPQCSPMDSMRIGHREGPHTVPRPLQMGAADGTVTSLDSQGFTMVTHDTRSP